MKKLSILLASVFLLSACGSESEAVNKEDLATYEIISTDSADNGSVTVELEIDTSDMDELKKTVQYIIDERYEETGIDKGRYDIESMRFKVYEKDTGDLLSNATVALSSKGTAQTGLTKQREVEYK